MTCNDTGYQAIEFDAETHIPKVNHLFVMEAILLPQEPPSNSEEFLYFEDLFLISRAALEIELYALAIKFLVASVISHQKNKCTFITSDNKCRAYNFHSVQTRYIGKHNFALLNNSNANFDSAQRFPFRINFG